MRLEQAAQLVWEAWFEAMGHQGRAVEFDRRSWRTLPERDKDIDRQIAARLCAAFDVTLDP